MLTVTLWWGKEQKRKCPCGSLLDLDRICFQGQNELGWKHRLFFSSPPWICIYDLMGFLPSAVSPEGHLNHFFLCSGIPIFCIAFKYVGKKSPEFWRLKWSRNLLLLAAMQIHRDGPNKAQAILLFPLWPYNLRNLDSLAGHYFGNLSDSTTEAEGEVTHFPTTTTSDSWRQITNQFLGQQDTCLQTLISQTCGEEMKPPQSLQHHALCPQDFPS